MDDHALALPPKQARSRRSIEKALEGAITVIGEAGWSGFTMPAVSREAGVSIPLLHARFGGKDELFLAAQASVLQQIETHIAEVFSGPRWDGMSAAESIDEAVRQLATIYSRHSKLLRRFLERGVSDERVRDRAMTTMTLQHRGFSERILSFESQLRFKPERVGVDVCYASACSSFNHEIQFDSTQPMPRGWDELVSEVASACRYYLLHDLPPRPAYARPQPPSPPPARADGDTRERLLRSATEILAESGYQGLTASAVSSRAQIAVGSFYNYFHNKEELVTDVEERALDQLNLDAAQLLGEPVMSEVPEMDVVPAAIAALVSLVEANRAAVRVLVQRQQGAHLTDHSGGGLDDVRDRFRDAITRHHVLKHPDPAFATSVCFLIVYSALTSRIPHDAYMASQLNPERLYAEQTRLCSQYLETVR